MPSWIASRVQPARLRVGSLRSLVPQGPQRAPIGSRQLWLAVAAGSVALLLLALRHRRPRRSAESAAAVTPLPKAAAPARNPIQPPVERPLREVAAYSIELPLPAIHRAALAINLGKPGDLRRLARDLRGIGQDIEAGLLENYAILLERSHPDRDRLLAEVTRMLREAGAERRRARRNTPAIPWPPNAAGPPPALSTAKTALRSNAIVLLPLLTLGPRRASG